MTIRIFPVALLLASCAIGQPVNAETKKSAVDAHVDIVSRRIQFCAAASDEAMNLRKNPLDVVAQRLNAATTVSAAEKLAIVDACFAFLAGRIYQVGAGQPA